MSACRNRILIVRWIGKIEKYYTVCEVRKKNLPKKSSENLLGMVDRRRLDELANKNNDKGEIWKREREGRESGGERKRRRIRRQGSTLGGEQHGDWMRGEWPRVRMYQGDMRSNGERGIEYYKIHRRGETRCEGDGECGNIIDTEHIPMIGIVVVKFAFEWYKVEEKRWGEEGEKLEEVTGERFEVVFPLILVNTEPHRPPASSFQGYIRRFRPGLRAFQV